jgi:hypothetical protein
VFSLGKCERTLSREVLPFLAILVGSESAQQPVALRLKGDVGFLGMTGFEELSMRLELQTLVAAHLSTGPQTCSLETLDPFDRNRFADPKARRGAPAVRRLCANSGDPRRRNERVKSLGRASRPSKDRNETILARQDVSTFL